MLVLNRRQYEQIRIGDEITVTVIEINGSRVKIGIEAPSGVSIHRQEVYERVQEHGDMKRATCPRCGYDRAKPNARGPDHVWCKRCGGLVPIQYDPNDGGPEFNCPVRCAVSNEREQRVKR